jgi:hypothetical protein
MEHPEVQKQLAGAQSSFAVDFKKPNRRSANWFFTADADSVESKVVGPFITPWIEKKCNFPSGWIYCCEIRPLHQITVWARQCPIGRYISSTVLPWSDVFNVKAQLREFLWKFAVLTAIAGTPFHKAPKSGRTHAAFGRSRKARASIFSTVKTELASTSDSNSARSRFVSVPLVFFDARRSYRF